MPLTQEQVDTAVGQDTLPLGDTWSVVPTMEANHVTLPFVTQQQLLMRSTKSAFTVHANDRHKASGWERVSFAQKHTFSRFSFFNENAFNPINENAFSRTLGVDCTVQKRLVIHSQIRALCTLSSVEDRSGCRSLPPAHSGHLR